VTFPVAPRLTVTTAFAVRPYITLVGATTVTAGATRGALTTRTESDDAVPEPNPVCDAVTFTDRLAP
jgi:hypothetical protein